MKIKFNIFCNILLLSILKNPAYAHDIVGAKFLSEKQQLGLISHINLSISDQVTGGCWLNSSTVKSKTRLSFEQNNIKVSSSPFRYNSVNNPVVTLKVLGYKINGGCVVTTSIDVQHVSGALMGGQKNNETFYLSKFVSSWQKSSLMSGTSPMDDRIDSYFEGYVSELIADIIVARRDPLIRSLIESFPALSDEPEL